MALSCRSRNNTGDAAPLVCDRRKGAINPTARAVIANKLVERVGEKRPAPRARVISEKRELHKWKIQM